MPDFFSISHPWKCIPSSFMWIFFFFLQERYTGQTITSRTGPKDPWNPLYLWILVYGNIMNRYMRVGSVVLLSHYRKILGWTSQVTFICHSTYNSGYHRNDQYQQCQYHSHLICSCKIFQVENAAVFVNSESLRKTRLFFSTLLLLSVLRLFTWWWLKPTLKLKN